MRGENKSADRIYRQEEAASRERAHMAADIEQLERAIVADDRPDLTLVFDLPVEDGLARAKSRAGGEARFESKGPVFHERLRAAYLRLAEREPVRCVVIDAAPHPDRVAESVWTTIAKRLPAGKL